MPFPAIFSSLLINFLHYSWEHPLLLSFQRKNRILLLRNHWPLYSSQLADYFQSLFHLMTNRHNQSLLKNRAIKVSYLFIWLFYIRVFSSTLIAPTRIFTISFLIHLYLTSHRGHFGVYRSISLYLLVGY